LRRHGPRPASTRPRSRRDRLARQSGHHIAVGTRAAPFRRGCFTNVTDQKLFVIEHQGHRSGSKQINRADPAEALRSSPDASIAADWPSRCCLAPMPSVCETASVQLGSQVDNGARSCSLRQSRRRALLSRAFGAFGPGCCNTGRGRKRVVSAVAWMSGSLFGEQSNVLKFDHAERPLRLSSRHLRSRGRVRRRV
jgi:hypothetical protein